MKNVKLQVKNLKIVVVLYKKVIKDIKNINTTPVESKKNFFDFII